jgi:uncharacterized protein YbjT (DUF2867 family)
MIPGPRPRVLIVGGGNGLVGRALIAALRSDYQIRTAHRRADPWESARGVEWVPTDVARTVDWIPRLEGVHAIVNLAWYRHARAKAFQDLEAGLERLLEAAARARVARFVQISVPSAPEELEARLPYLRYKRRFSRALATGGVPYTVLRPSALFGPGDRLLGVMMRLIRRYPIFPMFGDGSYRLSPLSARDLARIIRASLAPGPDVIRDLGGPRCYRYQELTDLMFRIAGKRARYWRMSPASGQDLASLLQFFGSSLLYRYELDWLLSDRLGLPSAEDLAPRMDRVEPYLRWVGGRPPTPLPKPWVPRSAERPMAER